MDLVARLVALWTVAAAMLAILDVVCMNTSLWILTWHVITPLTPFRLGKLARPARPANQDAGPT